MAYQNFNRHIENSPERDEGQQIFIKVLIQNLRFGLDCLVSQLLVIVSRLSARLKCATAPGQVMVAQLKSAKAKQICASCRHSLGFLRTVAVKLCSSLLGLVSPNLDSMKQQLVVNEFGRFFNLMFKRFQLYF